MLSDPQAGSLDVLAFQCSSLETFFFARTFVTSSRNDTRRVFLKFIRCDNPLSRWTIILWVRVMHEGKEKGMSDLNMEESSGVGLKKKTKT